MNMIDKVTWPQFTQALKLGLKSSGEQMADKGNSLGVWFKNFIFPFAGIPFSSKLLFSSIDIPLPSI